MKASTKRSAEGSPAHEPAAAELTPAQLKGLRRSQKISRRVLDAVALIRREMSSNKGVYPANGGEVSLAEIARRADVHPGTYYTTAQKGKEAHLAAKALVDELVPPVESSPQTSSRRQTLQQRLIDYQLEVDGLSASQDLTELQLQDAEAERDKAREERDEALSDRNKAIAAKHSLQVQVESLLQRLAIAESKNVHPLRPK